MPIKQLTDNDLKYCKYCNTTKPLKDFPKRGNKCKACVAEYQKQYYESHKEEIADNQKQYREKHQEEVAGYQKQYYEDNKEKILEYHLHYYEDNKEEILEYQKIYYEDNKDIVSAYNKQYFQNNKEELTEYKNQYRENNREEITKFQKQYREEHKENRNNYEQERRKSDPSYKLRTDVSRSVLKYLNKEGGNKNGASCMDYLPWTIEEFWEDFEKKFVLPKNLTPDGKIWMTRENRGQYIAKDWADDDPSTWKWQVDHIIPHSEFPYTSMEEDIFKKCWALENLRPLSAKQNQMDGATRIRHRKENR